MKKGDKLYVRIDYRTDKDFTNQDLQEHLVYVNNVAKERYFVGGGFSDTDGGLCLFEADNFEEAEKISLNDPIIKKGIYRYDIHEWNLAVLSK